MVRVHEVTKDELRLRRQRILDELDVTYEELRVRARSYRLVGDEWAAWEEIIDIDFLLSGE